MIRLKQAEIAMQIFVMIIRNDELGEKKKIFVSRYYFWYYVSAATQRSYFSTLHVVGHTVDVHGATVYYWF